MDVDMDSASVATQPDDSARTRSGGAIDIGIRTAIASMVERATPADAARLVAGQLAILDFEARSMEAVDADHAAKTVEAKAMAAAEGGTEAQRKARAYLEAAQHRRRADVAEARARAAARLVDLLVGGGRS